MNLPNEPEHVDHRPASEGVANFLRRYRIVFVPVVVVLLFFLYVDGLSTNPPGFYVDESGIAYNAYLISHTGAGELGGRFPLFFQFYTSGWTQWANPTQIYLLAIPFLIFKPSIWLARVYSASWMFAAWLVLGFLSRKISGRRRIGVIVTLLALLTPWLFEVSRLVFETFFYPIALVLFLGSLYYAQRKQSWSRLTIGTLVATLMLLTYTSTIGRLLGLLLAFGLVLFSTSKERVIGVAQTWLFFAITLLPILAFKLSNPEALTQRFYLISYIKPESPWREIVPKFIRRYLEDFSLISLLIDGDGNPRHHMPGSLGSFLAGVFILAIIGVVIVLARHWRDPWWRFILFGTLVSVVAVALTLDQFHSLRLVAYPIFLLLLTVPALQFLIARPTEPQTVPASADVQPLQPAPKAMSTVVREAILFTLLLAAVMQAMYFQSVFRREGSPRGYVFDAAYKEIFDTAMALPDRPIYLVDGTSPAYVHAYWYATVEGRNRAELIHMKEGIRPPMGALVIGSEANCGNCQVIKRSGEYMLYRSFGLLPYQPR